MSETIHYSHNNSGGRDWLTADDWAALAARGWVLDTYEGRTYGADRTGLSLDEAIREWEVATGQPSTAEGCPCCGPPHYFYRNDRAEMGLAAAEVESH